MLLNQKADEYAKKGRALHGVQDANERCHQAERKRLTTAIIQMAKCLAAWPAPRTWAWVPRRLKEKTAAVEAKPIPRASPHHFSKGEGKASNHFGGAPCA